MSAYCGIAARIGDDIDLGVLTCELPPALIDEVLEKTARREQRHRKLPARAVVYFVLALCLFSGSDSLCPPGYRSVMGMLLSGLTGLYRRHWDSVSSSALTQARQRLGAAPLKALFERVRGPLSTVGAPWADAFGLRVVAWDGTTVEVPDSPANAKRFGYVGYSRDVKATSARVRAAKAVARSGRRSGASIGSNPLVRLMTLVECGTHAVIDVAFDSAEHVSELALAPRLAQSLRPGMLLLADRMFCGYEIWAQAAVTGADLLWRAKNNTVFFPVKHLPDGSFLSVIPTPAESHRYGMARFHRKRIDTPPQGHQVRVVEYTVTITAADGSTRVEPFRLVTTLLDHRRAPARQLAELYAQRWEAETAYGKFKTRLRGADMVLRSRSPEGVIQELYAFFVLYQVLCRVHVAAAATVGIDPDRISFTVTIRAARSRTSQPLAILTIRQRQQAITSFIRELLCQRLPERRSRQCPRQRRPPRNRYEPKRRDHPRPCLKTTCKIQITSSGKANRHA